MVQAIRITDFKFSIPAVQLGMSYIHILVTLPGSFLPSAEVIVLGSIVIQLVGGIVLRQSLHLVVGKVCTLLMRTVLYSKALKTLRGKLLPI